ncbi:hypothetical protein C2857_007440 [Epichloe festucae Fl1]|uniref:MoaB/Mog domain-containing protein n=1 Tax=Epichloe festucae (strain Fl1) TaxID=877507 RepID=A0A7S9PSV7_EPIFF|nr:hypothetical protein C2857_007440 [Epichloe festucae Fl1]
MTTLQERCTRTIRTGACLIIGNEVLGGQTVDTNSAYVAKWCFCLGIELQRTEVIPDVEGDIKEAVRRMSSLYDFVVTSGGIGPTHDDITYESVAKAFDLKLMRHEETFARMKELSRKTEFDWETDSPSLRAKLRMATLPTDESRSMSDQCVFPAKDLWVPVSIVNGNVHILPGVPALFVKLLDGLEPYLRSRLDKPFARVMISTPQPESVSAGYLTTLAAKVKSLGVKVGSYPRWGKERNTITLVGSDLKVLEDLVPEVEENVQGRRVETVDELDHLDD